VIRQEYLCYLQALKAANASPSVCKIANLVSDNLDTLQPLSTYQGQRAKKLVELAQSQWQSVREDISDDTVDVDSHPATFKQLTSLRVGPFRGFARGERFDLNSRLVLIYGPNGTGKTSFCEALEFGLLGNVAEADSKRIRPQDYFKNAYVDRYEPPVLEALGSDDQVYSVTPNEPQNRFCFVEKNRIDNFSRIAAQLPAKQSELISTLFGLDSFSDFVHNFTPELDGRYIDLFGAKNLLLTQKNQSLVTSHQQIKENSEALMQLVEEEGSLANQYKTGMSFAEMLAALGTSDQPGEIATLEAELQQPIAVKSGFTVASLEEQRQIIEGYQANLAAKKQELAASSTALSFKQLYSSVSSLEQINRDECPACKTPVSKTNVNPFELASQELAKLAHLSQLEQERDQLVDNLSEAIKRVYQMLKTACERFATNPLQAFLRQHESEINITWWGSLLEIRDDGYTAWQHLWTQVQKLEQMDAAIDQVQQVRISKQARLNQLREFDRQATILKTRRSTLTEGLQRAQGVIDTFNEVNAALIAKAAAEQPITAQNKEIASAYASFVSRLSRYKDELPGKLIADLGEKVVQLYNAFNRNDPPNDLLASIRLPLAQGQRIEVAFQGNPERWFDALHVLSEGHIRCLGLAILMAKNIKENCPVLIFDDPVNAIDDDHRESIRRTLFGDDTFHSTQIILTCHGEEFFKDIHNLLGSERSSSSKSFTFLPRLDEQHIRIDFNCAPRNYILAAQEHIDNLEVREALSKARQALEALTKGKLWRYVNRYGDGNLSIKLRSAAASIELRNLTEQLKSKITKTDFSHADKGTVLSPLDALLGINGDSREWRYLNKGTHEENDRAEFDRPVVASIIQSLTQLDAALS